MKILIVHNRYQIPGGEDQVAAQEAELLRAHGHQVFTYSRDNGELKTFSLWQKLALPFWTLYNPKTIGISAAWCGRTGSMWSMFTIR